MKTAKVLIGLVIGLFATTTMFQMFAEESGAGLFGALTGYVLIMVFCVWLVYSGSKSKQPTNEISEDEEDTNFQKPQQQSSLPSTVEYRKLKDLYESGILTKEEFEAKTQTVVQKKETKNSGSVKTVFIVLIVLGLVGFGVSQKDEILRFVNGTTTTTTTTQKPQINNIISETNTPKRIEEKIIWNEKKVANFSFSLPSNFQFESNLSSYNKKVYVADDETLGLTIDIADLPSGYENSLITEMIPSIDDFGISINQDNKRYFDDFKLKYTLKSTIGNKESIEITQTSTKVSGKNIPMMVKAHFIITNPYYCSITFSYPENSFQGKQTIDRIKNSFKFETSKKIKKEQTHQVQNTNQPTLKESQEWLVNKLKDNLVDYSDSRELMLNRYVFKNHYYKSVGIINGNLVFEYQEKLSYSYNFGDTTIEDIKVIIPFNKIIKNDFVNYRTSNGKCNFEIYTQSNAITEINLSTGEKRYRTFYEFSFDCSVDEILGSRIDKAILHIKDLIPNKVKTNNDLF